MEYLKCTWGEQSDGMDLFGKMMATSLSVLFFGLLLLAMPLIMLGIIIDNRGKVTVWTKPSPHQK